MQQVPESSSQTSIITNDGGNTDAADWDSLPGLASSTMNSDTTTKSTDNQSSKETAVEDANEDYSVVMKNPWDPLRSSDWDSQIPDATCIARIKRDISGIMKDPPPGMFISPDPDNLTKIHALVIGPFDTPYEGGFFYFILRFPPSYPHRAPRCRLMTTGNNTVRFNPNLYANGKVCLSILGTWTGPSWSPAQCLSSVLISIQSLMSENPYHNEPGYEQERTSGDSKTYNEIIKHETLRVAVCEMLENQNSCPKQLYDVICKQFFDFYDYYVEVCTENMSKDGQPMEDPFHDRRGQFQYASILTRLNKLKATLENDGSTKEQHSSVDARTQEIMNDAAALYSNLPPASNDIQLDDIFDEDDDDDDDNEDVDNDDMEQ
ncbi:unnamed protein product [Adineta steineri]|uniref:Ubiquitin-conjugating enzyme E2 Z n=1 Tax=Adineta steineri TaxID=433720 RepID=A0A814EJM9_9BILA|nr:unnamed protein product [Adineta steineri]CAF3960265.1 unnamed protein product [Adineta steineri]